MLHPLFWWCFGLWSSSFSAALATTRASGNGPCLRVSLIACSLPLSIPIGGHLKINLARNEPSILEFSCFSGPMLELQNRQISWLPDRKMEFQCDEKNAIWFPDFYHFIKKVECSRRSLLSTLMFSDDDNAMSLVSNKFNDSDEATCDWIAATKFHFNFVQPSKLRAVEFIIPLPYRGEQFFFYLRGERQRERSSCFFFVLFY